MPKLTKCRICRTPFLKLSISHKVCSPACALELAKRDREKKARKADKVTRERLKTRSAWMKEAQAAFNKYIRLRDAGKPCIDGCGKPMRESAVGGGYDCGHYRSVGSARHLRFNEHNAHGQHKQCNRWGSGRAVDYRLGLIARIGLAAVETLEADQTEWKYTIPELQEIKRIYILKAKEWQGRD